MNKRRYGIEKITTRLATWIIMWLVVSFSAMPVYAQEKESVRVGYYPVTNYQEVKKDGSYYGFGYDYFVQIQKYTRWDYEFIGASYADCMKMLQNGEIDIMGGVGMTPERTEAMYFSDYSVNASQNNLYAKSDNPDLFYESYDAFDGCRIAMMKGMLTDEVEAYSKKHGFHVEIETYDSMNAMVDALMNHQIDMICSSSIPNDADAKIVAKMDKKPLYYVVSKSRPRLYRELNEALRNITDDNPEFYAQMSQKYKMSGANASATFTREETEYIASGQKLYVIVNPNWAPLTWQDKETGEFHGIFIDVIKRIREYSGLQSVICTEAEFDQLVVQNPELENNVVAILTDDNSWAAKQNVMMSNDVVASSVVMVSRRNDRRDNVAIALPKNFYIGYAMQEALESKEVVEYDTVQDCLDAVNSGKVDATYINEVVATYYLSMLEYSNLFASANTGYYENLAFAVFKESPAPILTILNKSLLGIGTEEINQIIVQNAIAEERFSVAGLYYTNPELVIGLSSLFALLLFLIVFAVYRMRRNRQIAERELKKEAEINNARTEFFMMISHELRTPLNAIVGYLNFVSEEHQKNGWEMEYVRRSQNAARQLTEIAEGMLDYTQIASNSFELKEELFDLKEVIMNVDQSISLRAAAKDLKFRITLDDLVHEYVAGDQLRVAEIFQNLLSNGVKFTDRGGTVEANIREEAAEDGRIRLIFTCRDTGRGMPEAFIEKICAPFKQGDEAYSRTHGGIGLGLYLTKYFVDTMDGTFEVQSKLGEGSCFTVSLMLKCPNSEQILKSNIDCSHVRAVIGGTDEEDNAHLKALLKRLKIKCDTITDAEKLKKRIRSRIGGDYQYTLCILDDTLLEAADTIVGDLCELEAPPILFVLTSDSRKIDLWFADQRISRVLYKPIFQSVLFDAVMDVFGEYKLDAEADIREDFTGIHAMIAEDNVINADILTRILEKSHVTAAVCANGQIAADTFEQADDGTYDIIFMDIQMPVLNGYEAAVRIRNSEKAQSKTIPIVAVSANAFPEDIQRSMEAGMNEHLSKPVNERRLCETIKKLVTLQKD